MSETTARVEPYCNDCDKITEEVRLYVCNSCGQTSDERRCNDCNLFMARHDELGCSDCLGENIEDVEVVEDHDGSLIRAEDFDPDGESLAVREAQEAQTQKEAAKERERLEVEEATSGAELKTWADVKIGDRILLMKGRRGQRTVSTDSARVVSLARAGENPEELPPGAIIATIDRMWIEADTHSPSDPVWVIKEQEEPAHVPSVSERYVIEYTDSVFDYARNMGHLYLTGRKLSRTIDDGLIAVVSLMGRTSEYSNMIHRVGIFCAPQEALDFAEFMDRLAESLESKGVPEGERITPQWDTSAYAEFGGEASPYQGMIARVGPAEESDSEWIAEVLPEGKRGRQGFFVGFPAAARNMAEGARMAAAHLKSIYDME